MKGQVVVLARAIQDNGFFPNSVITVCENKPGSFLRFEKAMTKRKGGVELNENEQALVDELLGSPGDYLMLLCGHTRVQAIKMLIGKEEPFTESSYAHPTVGYQVNVLLLEHLSEEEYFTLSKVDNEATSTYAPVTVADQLQQMLTMRRMVAARKMAAEERKTGGSPAGKGRGNKRKKAGRKTKDKDNIGVNDIFELQLRAVHGYVPERRQEAPTKWKDTYKIAVGLYPSALEIVKTLCRFLHALPAFPTPPPSVIMMQYIT